MAPVKIINFIFVEQTKKYMKRSRLYNSPMQDCIYTDNWKYLSPGSKQNIWN